MTIVDRDGGTNVLPAVAEDTLASVDGEAGRCAPRPRSILIIVENLPVPFDRRVWQEAVTLTRAGYSVSVICPVGKGCEKRFEMLEGVAIYRHPLPFEASKFLGYIVEYSIALFWEFRLALRVNRERGFDVIHACNPPDLIFIIGAYFRLMGKKFLFDHHDLSPELYESKFRYKGVSYWLLRLFEWLTFRTATTVISTNQSYRRIALTRGKKDAAQVFVVRSGPDLNRWPATLPVDPSLRRGRKFLVGYVGVMSAQEGLDLLIETIRIVVFERGRRDIEFVLVGDGPERPKLESLVTGLGLRDFVTLAGRVPDDTLFAVLGTADVCVNPDRYSVLNNFSTMNKIVEYMASARPIVQYDLYEGRVSAGDASLYARPNDPEDFAEQILALLGDRELRTRMGQIGRARVEGELAWEHQETSLLAAYRSLFEN